MKLSSLLVFLKAPNILPFLSVMSGFKSSIRMNFYHAALDSGLFGALAVPVTYHDLGNTLRVKRPELLEALLDLGLSLKELGQKKDGRYYLKSRTARLLGTYEGDALAAVIQACATYYHNTYHDAARRMLGAPLGNDLFQAAPIVARFSRLIEPFIWDALAPEITRLTSPRVLDVGCGMGGHLLSISRINGRTTGYGVEIDRKVSDEASQNLRDWSIDDRFSIVHGDALSPLSELAGPFDMITLINFIYYLPCSERPRLISAMKSRLLPGGMLVVAANMQSKGRDAMAANLDMVNRSMEGTHPLPDLDELIESLKASDFSEIKKTRLLPGSMYYLVTARRTKTN